MIKFEKVADGVSMLHVPFGDVWTGVALVRGDGVNILVDSGPNSDRVDDCIIPALKEEGLSLSDISYVLPTHTHGDHVGGLYRMKELNPKIKISVYRESLDRMRDPLKYNIQIRQSFPEYSPAPTKGLRGIEPDELLDEGAVIGGMLKLIATPGHDNDAISWYHLPTKTILTGDSLQANGTSLQGIGLYMYYPEYRETLIKLRAMDIENIAAGHPFLPVGALAIGKSEVGAYLVYCQKKMAEYHKFISDRLDSGLGTPVTITEALIRKQGQIHMPDYLFLALHTVTSHIKAIKSENLN